MNDKRDEGVSVKQIEAFARQYRIEVFYCLLIILACLFSWVFLGVAWSIAFTGLGVVLGVVFPHKVEFFAKKSLEFAFKHEPTVLIVLAVVSLIIAVFLPLAVFFMFGLQGGKALFHQTMEISSLHKKKEGGE